ncbi:hypothetical protein A3A76_02255 [Candidatus Woesebacteria bacterium RIFCSPLOWO2_01_FULL_39_23]|uniref:Uncharacterized protein n=1 Tax=Candidatus Woesebacteria bacterium RIFCSPHIGHO2_01_FULL_40_22 TaxID=1802499 RepID=A0A1F7YFY7_9BACT|nr:MAG: hypothetical protein A2141_03410 [Candidatus Woesebacteria bacterium RBG_16_40_11]OGM26223.1 MAG: hypothetical protein A2628_02690 [Candidatus Woesebacteria bacterium RIFCSPHIGHO2_01_FULL_40_22]OGM36481.1 MAG: hypothetical protein A3E41_00510 [Candidatus Woesebacteria bacterium RIFCSPHIGHO2_12_FULL_38_9]OGM62381.1 MAG: hypothetical protein A3A76_02255 [Candidatus Woesebacteria bacterium RIFCSPLOWO2_01_FULL_39_23]
MKSLLRNIFCTFFTFTFSLIIIKTLFPSSIYAQFACVLTTSPSTANLSEARTIYIENCDDSLLCTNQSCPPDPILKITYNPSGTPYIIHKYITLWPETVDIPVNNLQVIVPPNYIDNGWTADTPWFPGAGFYTIELRSHDEQTLYGYSQFVIDLNIPPVAPSCCYVDPDPSPSGNYCSALAQKKCTAVDKLSPLCADSCSGFGGPGGGGCFDSTVWTCQPSNNCIGYFTDLPGNCYYLNCPPDRDWDGINPPHDTIGCPLGMSCCIDRQAFPLTPRPMLSVNCTRYGQEGIYTAVGCIPVANQTEFLSFILPWAIGLGGGIAFIVIILSGFMIMTSAGNPARAKTGKELLTAAIMGLLMIIFSVYLLDVIGLRILRIPGL